jgi:formylglycine-generating enzyme required for sulfatase activity
VLHGARQPHGGAGLPPPEPVAPLPETNGFIALPDGSLLVQEHEVTRGEFALWLQRAHPDLAAPAGDSELPVVNVTRALAAEYCAAFPGARLPTRDEWRRALGANLPWTLAVTPARGLAAGGSSPRDERSLSAGSLYDLVANVNEWTVDGADNNAYAMGAFFGEPRDTVADYLREGNVEAGPSEHTGLRCVR